jgi:hypothetical protein
MRFRHRVDAQNDSMAGNAPESGDRQTRELWRELARLITLFDEHSPHDFS